MEGEQQDDSARRFEGLAFRFRQRLVVVSRSPRDTNLARVYRETQPRLISQSDEKIVALGPDSALDSESLEEEILADTSLVSSESNHRETSLVPIGGGT